MLPEPKHHTLESLLVAVRACRTCEAQLPLGPRPVLRATATARILIVRQAPGVRVHRTGVPWDDPSGARLRDWMGVSTDVFYDESRVAIIPMGYCYPGRGKGGDLPPRRECAQLWLEPLLAKLPMIELTLLIGQHAQRHFPASDARRLWPKRRKRGRSTVRAMFRCLILRRATRHGRDVIPSLNSNYFPSCARESRRFWSASLRFCQWLVFFEHVAQPAWNETGRGGVHDSVRLVEDMHLFDARTHSTSATASTP
jgi:uracil-DNA glycosylase